MASESPKKVGNFDVLKVMCERNMDVRLSTLDNVRSARKVKGGSEVRIGVAGDIVTGIALGKFVGGLLIADKEQFNQVKCELEGPRAKTQQYFCPACRYAGAVEHEENADVYTVINLMEDDHKRNRPHCYQGIRGMRVRNPAMCSDQEWEQIISGGTIV